MTIRTANSTLCDLSFKDGCALATMREKRDFQACELGIEVVEFQDDGIGLAAVDARVTEQVFEQPAIQDIRSFSDVAIGTLDIECLVLAVVRPAVDGKPLTTNATASSCRLVGERKLLERLEQSAHSALWHARTLRMRRHGKRHVSRVLEGEEVL
jgi:hypothetical protein